MKKWIRRMAGLLVVLGLLAGGGLLTVRQFEVWTDQNEQRAAAARLARDLDAEIASWEGEIARRSTTEAVREAALCFGPYVDPGTEVYAVPGLTGCLAQPVSD